MVVVGGPNDRCDCIVSQNHFNEFYLSLCHGLGRYGLLLPTFCYNNI